jgi:hypothetical protein
MRPDHPNAWMRPSTQALVHKLRELKTLQDLDVAEVVILDMIHWYFIRTPHPRRLWRILAQTYHRWGYVMGMLSGPVVGNEDEREMRSVDVMLSSQDDWHWDKFFSHRHPGSYGSCVECGNAPRS